MMRSGLISVLGVLGVLSPAAAMAQEPPGAAPLEPAYSGNRPLGLYPGGESEYVRNGRAMRRVGIPLTIAGAIALPMGIVLTSVAAGCAYTGACSYPAYAALTGFGLVGVIGGVGALGAGIPLWAIGTHRLRRAGLGDVRASLLPGFGVEGPGQATGRLLLTLTY